MYFLPLSCSYFLTISYVCDSHCIYFLSYHLFIERSHPLDCLTGVCVSVYLSLNCYLTFICAHMGKCMHIGPCVVYIAVDIPWVKYEVILSYVLSCCDNRCLMPCMYQVWYLVTSRKHNIILVSFWPSWSSSRCDSVNKPWKVQSWGVRTCYVSTSCKFANFSCQQLKHAFWRAYEIRLIRRN